MRNVAAPEHSVVATVMRAVIVSVGLTLTVALLSIPFRSWLQLAPSSLFMLAVILASWYGGKGAGLLTTVLALIAIDFVLFEPLYTFAPNAAYVPSGLVFGVCAVGVAELTARRRSAERELRLLNETLEQRVYVRTRDLQKANEELRHEIQSRTEAEKELAKKRDELLASNGNLSEFASMAAHDLREPLRTFQSFSELLQRRHAGALPAEAAQLIDVMQGAAQRMHRLLEDLLAYAIADSDLDRKETVSLSAIVHAVKEDLKGSIGQAGARIKCDPLPDVTGNATQLAQVLQNLLANAMKYRSEDAPYVHIWAYADGHTWVICVRDNGVGFEQSDADRIFRPFKRLHGRDIPGTGMGLAICKRIVERHGGRIWAESVRGYGSTFRFSLPAAVEERAGVLDSEPRMNATTAEHHR